MTHTMSVKQTLSCELNSPEKWQNDYNGCGADDGYNLPSCAPVNVYAVDEYPACPDNWMHGSDITSSYFAGLKEDWALWFDFNACFNHTHDVAVVLSVQGINPLTGQTMIGENPLRLEQYHKTCPIHNIKFQQDYFCKTCGFKWPGQNYMATTGTPFGMFWIDGFRTPDGKVRQYIITAEKMRGVAAQMMKNPDDRVFAIGMAFYISKARKPDIPKPKPSKNSGLNTFSSLHKNSIYAVSAPSSATSTSSMPTSAPIKPSWGFMSMGNSMGNRKGGFCGSPRRQSTMLNCSASLESLSFDNYQIDSLECSPINIVQDIDISDEDSKTITPVKKLEVGAGALISQLIYDDPKAITYWEEKPDGMIYLNYCDEKTLKKILDAGKRADKKDGFMNGICVGG